MSALLGIVGRDGMCRTGIDHACNCVLALPGAVEKAPPDRTQVELSWRVRFEAAEAKTFASCAVM